MSVQLLWKQDVGAARSSQLIVDVYILSVLWSSLSEIKLGEHSACGNSCVMSSLALEESENIILVM